ncbi:glycosyltransferase family 2 protein [Pseudoclavibacter soli]|uniref:glycosyltransferase family 2 protein n=1 Tax=Pseudoclavibacter soli TaxID=452623 RepID=UPI003CCBF4C6
MDGLAGIEGITEVLVADDASTDDSAVLALEAGARVVTLDRDTQHGYGAAIRYGLEHVRTNRVIIADADDTYPVGDQETIRRFLADMTEDSFVVGNRWAHGTGSRGPLLNRIGTSILSAFGRTIAKVDVRDFHCGMRGGYTETVRRLGRGSTGFEWASTSILDAADMGLRFVQPPVRLKTPLAGRSSHIRPVKDAVRHIDAIAAHERMWWHATPPQT